MTVHLGIGVGHAVSLPALALVGLFVGWVAGMFGVGGGFLLTPLLMYVFGVPAPVAVGSALCQKCGTSIASFVKYRALGRGEPRFDLVMMGGSVIGVDAGTRLLHRLRRAPVFGRRQQQAHAVSGLYCAAWVRLDTLSSRKMSDM